MGLNWLESMLYGLVSGFADILPISAQAHRTILLKFFGIGIDPAFLRLFVHLGVLLAVFFTCQPMITKLMRARSLARVPKRRRKRPLDTKSLMDLSLWKTMLIPVIIGFFFYEKLSGIGSNLIWMSCFLFVNGLILYIPQFLPGSNKDSRSLSRVEGLLMGLGGTLSMLPGLSGLGAAVSIGSVCGVERSYGLNMALLMNIGVNLGFVIFDVMAVASKGLTGITFLMILQCLVSGIVAFVGAMLGIKMMRSLAKNGGFSLFAYYCWGIALFSFILNLMA